MMYFIMNIDIYDFVYDGKFPECMQSDDFSEKFHERMYASVTNEHLSPYECYGNVLVFYTAWCECVRTFGFVCSRVYRHSKNAVIRSKLVFFHCFSVCFVCDAAQFWTFVQFNRASLYSLVVKCSLISHTKWDWNKYLSVCVCVCLCAFSHCSLSAHWMMHENDWKFSLGFLSVCSDQKWRRRKRSNVKIDMKKYGGLT